MPSGPGARVAATGRPGDILSRCGPAARWAGTSGTDAGTKDPYPPGGRPGVIGGMFIGGEARAAVSAAAATARLACPACGGGVLIRASYAAWEEVTAGIAPAGLPGLVLVRSQGPVQRGAVSVLIMRWEAADASGQRFPVLDADITLVPDGEQATLIGLHGVYRPLPGAGLCPVIAYLVTVATTRSFLGRITAAITDPAAEQRREAGRAAVRPGTLAVASPMTAQSGKAENLEALRTG